MLYAILNTDKAQDYYGNIWGVYIQSGQYLVTHSDTGYNINDPWYTYNTEAEFLTTFSWVS